MDVNLVCFLTSPALAGLVSIVACPAICAFMAYRVSRIYAQGPRMSNLSNSKVVALRPNKSVEIEAVSVNSVPLNEAEINAAVKNAVF